MNVATHVVTADDGSLPGTPEEQRHLLTEWTAFDLDAYYTFVKAFTFETRFVAVDAAQLLRALSRADDAEWLGAVEAQLDALVAHFGGVAFVKLTTRSPKDAVDKPAAGARSLFATELAALLGAGTPSMQDLVLALQRSFARALCVASGHEAMRLFASSNRIVSDLVRWTKLLPDRVIHVAVRPFVLLPPSSEFRCFVCQRRITCASQYMSQYHFPALAAAEYWLAPRLQQFVGRLIEALPAEYASFIADVAVLREEEEDGCVLIELNPFGTLTGSGATCTRCVPLGTDARTLFIRFV